MNEKAVTGAENIKRKLKFQKCPDCGCTNFVLSYAFTEYERVLYFLPSDSRIDCRARREFIEEYKNLWTGVFKNAELKWQENREKVDSQETYFEKVCRDFVDGPDDIWEQEGQYNEGSQDYYWQIVCLECHKKIEIGSIFENE